MVQPDTPDIYSQFAGKVGTLALKLLKYGVLRAIKPGGYLIFSDYVVRANHNISLPKD